MPAVAYLAIAAAVLHKLDIPLYLKVTSALPIAAYSALVFPGTRSLFGPRIRAVILITGLAGISAALCYGINRQWIDHHGFNGAVWSIFARAIDRYGFAATRGNCYWTGGSVFVPSAPLYQHHPPGLTWTVALAFRAFGVREGVARAVPVLFTTCGIVSLAALLARRLGCAAAAGLFPLFLASPGLLYFGRMVNFEPVVLAIALIFYSWLLLAPRGAWATWMLALLVMTAPFFGWVGTPFALGGAWSLARHRLRWGARRSLVFALVPLTGFAVCVLYNSDWGRDLSLCVRRAAAWNSLVHGNMADYSITDWLRKVWQNGNSLLPWPSWLLFVALPFVRLRQTRAGILLRGCAVPFLIMVPFMPHAVYVHDYHMMFAWVPAAVASAHLVARFAHRTVPALVVSLLFLVPLRMGLGGVARMHGRNTYALHQARTGSSVNAVSDPEDGVAVINTAGDPAPILAYYLDRHYAILRRAAPAIQSASWKYYCFLHKFRGLPDSDRATVHEVLTPVPGTYVPTFTRRAPPVQSVGKPPAR